MQCSSLMLLFIIRLLTLQTVTAGECLLMLVGWLVVGVFLMSAAMIFGDNAFRLQCKDFWVGGGPPNKNYLSYSWGFEVAACVLSFISGGLIVWLAVITARDRKYAYYSTA